VDGVIFAAHDGGAIYSLVSTDRLLIRYLMCSLKHILLCSTSFLWYYTS